MNGSARRWRALVYEPKLLLLDEPLSALDNNLRKQMQIELRRVHRQVGNTTLSVTHDQTEAMTLSDRIVVFNCGRIEQTGAPLDVYNRPMSRFAATFVGDSNILDGRIGDDPAELMLPCGTRVRSPHSLPADHAGGASLLVRPEQIHVGEPSPSVTANSLTVQVSSVLNRGSSILIIGQHRGSDLRIRSAPSAGNAVAEDAMLPAWWESGNSWPIPPTLRRGSAPGRTRSRTTRITRAATNKNVPRPDPLDRRGTDPHPRRCGRGGIARCPPVSRLARLGAADQVFLC